MTMEIKGYINREHTERDNCWCEPVIETLPNGDTVCIHNDISEFFDPMSCAAKPLCSTSCDIQRKATE